MSRLTKGIETDVETALTMVKKSNLRIQDARRDHDQTIRELRTSLTMQEKRTDALQAENSELKSYFRTFIAAGEYNILQSQAVTLAESKLELEKTVIGLRKEIVDTRDAYLETERGSRVLLDESRKENESLKEEYKETAEKLQQEIASLRLIVSIKKDNESAKDVSDSDTDKTIQEETILKPEDDPVLDMTQQLILNREKIEILSRQNDRLSKTLCRLRQYQRNTISSGIHR
ncbi:uncharacterized protein LOC117157035 [Bombus vancouverensis nearcticus]|uniref:uncharacterized protein LOC117157035 n=1 Tax=Bombus vancouverensis nearcticus TaxID=2705178 RepID=UPI00402B88BF